MQNYGQHQAGYNQRPGSTTGFTTAPPPAVPPPYAAPQGYQSAAPQTQSQWAPPVQNHTPVQQQQQWTQPPAQHAGGYNPGVYGAMPGGYTQAQQAPTQVPASNAYSSPQDIPPPPPPKPYQIAAHGWTDHTSHGAQRPQQAHAAPQQNTGYTTHGQQGGYAQHTGPQHHATASSGAYIPPSQTPQIGQRPNSTYGAGNVGTYSTPSSAVAQQPPPSVLGPNAHNPAYAPPSLIGQGVQSHGSANANPLPGVYAPSPSDIPAWQPASHGPPHEGKFNYTKPSSDIISYNHGAPQIPVQGQYGQLPTQQPPPQYGQHQYPQTGQAQAPTQYGQPPQSQHLHGPPQQQVLYGNDAPQQPAQQTQYVGQPAPSYQHPQDHISQTPSQQQQLPNEWQPTPPADTDHPQQNTNPQASYGTHQQTWQPEYSAHDSGGTQGIQAPRPVGGHGGSIPPNAASESRTQSPPISPIHSRSSTGINFGTPAPGRTASVSSIALGAIHAQRAGMHTESPKPLPSLPAPPPPRDDATKFSALGTGGPSDWEHFGATEEVDDEELFAPKKDGRQGVPVLLDSVEVTSRISPSQMQGEWPTPPVQPATSDMSNRDAYQPTPPPDSTIQRPPSRSAAVGSVAVDNTVASHPQQHSQQAFVMEDVVIAPLKVSRPSSQRNTPAQEQARHQPPPSANPSHQVEFPPSVAPPIASQSKPAPTTGFAAEKESWERVRADLVKETGDLRAEVEQLKIIIATTKTHAEYERNVLVEQMDTMKAAAEQARSDSDGLITERNATIERLQEDGEGKTDAINEKDAEISRLRTESKAKDNTITESQALIDDLKRQLTVKDDEISNLKQQIKNNQTAEHLAQELKQQLEAEKSKEPPKPTPAALVQDLDPWYAGSLERYITMLRGEAQEASVEDKIKVFTSFLKAESSARGIDYHTAPPPAMTTQQQGVQSKGFSQEEPIPRVDEELSKLQTLPTDASEDDDIQYSPGGRPIVHRMTNPKFEELAHPHQTFSVSSQSTAVLTPTSSQDENPNQTPTPVQSEALQYKAYAPLSTGKSDLTQTPHRQSLSSVTPVILNPALSYGNKGDEVFFGGSHTTGTPSSRPSSGGGADTSAAVPAPLSLNRPHPLAIKTTTQSISVDKLANLPAVKVAVPLPNPQLETIREKLAGLHLDLPVLADLATSWEKSASIVRKEKDAARRKRQEESEEHTDQLFNDNEIAYADIAVIEDEFKEQERKLKAQEDRDEYNSYVDTVFNTVYDGLQQQIKSLMDLYTEVESLLPVSVSGKVALEGSDAPLTKDCLKLLEDLFELIEQRHDKVVEAVADRDKRYKKTEIQPLYAAGNITKMKQVEQHFARAEKEAAERAREEKAARVDTFVRIVETSVIAAVGVEQHEIQDIIAAARDVPPAPEHETLFSHAREAVLLLGESSKSLLELLNDVEIDVGGAILESQLAGARAEKQADQVAALERQIADREAGLKDELKRKEQVLEQDREEIEKAIKDAGQEASSTGEGAPVERSEEQIKQERLRMALEAAKRRNGDL